MVHRDRVVSSWVFLVVVFLAFFSCLKEGHAYQHEDLYAGYYSNVYTNPDNGFTRSWYVNFNSDVTIKIHEFEPGTLVVQSSTLDKSLPVTVKTASGATLPGHPHNEFSDEQLRRMFYLSADMIADNDTFWVTIPSPANPDAMHAFTVDFFEDDSNGADPGNYLTQAKNTVLRKKVEASRIRLMQDSQHINSDVRQYVNMINSIDAITNYVVTAAQPKATDIDHLFNAYELVSNAEDWAAYLADEMEDTQRIAFGPPEPVGAAIGDRLIDAGYALGNLSAGNYLPAKQTIIMATGETIGYGMGGSELYELEENVAATLIAEEEIKKHLRNDTIMNSFSNEALLMMGNTRAQTMNEDYDCSVMDNWLYSCSFDDYNQNEYLKVFRAMQNQIQSYIQSHCVGNIYSNVDGDDFINYDDAYPNDGTRPVRRLTYATEQNVSSSEPGQVHFMLWGLSEPLAEMDAVTVSYGDGASDTLYPASFPDDGVFEWTHDYSVQQSSYTVVVQYSVTWDGDEFAQSEWIRIPADEGPEDVEYSPNTYRVSPDFSTYHVVGDSISFKVRGVDPDENLDYVIWESEGPITLDDDRDDYNDGHEDTETVTGTITGDNNGEKMYVYATSYDTQGNSSERERWVLEARPNFEPVISKISPEGQNIQLGFGEHEFAVSVFDEDDNAGEVGWYLDGALVEEDATGGGNPGSNENYDLDLSQRDTHVLEAKIVDDDGNAASVSWHIEAGTSVDGNLPPEITKFELDEHSVPYEIFRVGKAYEFDVEATDPDRNLYSLALMIDGEIVYEDIDDTPDGSDHISPQIFFPTTGSHELTALARDDANETTEMSMMIEVKEADDSQGGAPAFGNTYPSGSTVWVPPGESLQMGGWVSDPDWDEVMIQIYVDNQLIDTENVRNDTNFDFYINRDDIPDAGTHALKLVPVDVTGKQGQAKEWTLIAGTGSHAPTITRVIPDVNEPIYVMQGENFKPRVFVEDVDGDLGDEEYGDDVAWDFSDVNDPDPEDSSNVSDFWDCPYGGVWPASSGVITATVYDHGGRNATTSFEIQVVQALQNHPPRILRGNIPEDGAHSVVLNDDGSFNVEYSVDVFDPDGDITSVELYKNGRLERQEQNVGYYLDKSFESNGSHASFADPYVPEARGQTDTYLFKVTDSQGNVLTREWTVTKGPVAESNHAPFVDETLTPVMNQYDSMTFTVNVIDEEGDVPVPAIENLGEGHAVEYLGDYTFRFTPDDDFYGDAGFDIVWDDGYGGIATTEVSVQVARVVLPPAVIQHSMSAYVDAGEPFNLVAALSDNVVSREYAYSQLLIKTRESDSLDIQGSSMVSEGTLAASLPAGADTGTVGVYFEDPDGRTSETVNVTVLLKSYRVTVDIPGGGGTCSLPNEVTSVYSGESLSMDFSPAAGYVLQDVSGCNGLFDGSTYTTGPLTDNCVVTAAFAVECAFGLSPAGGNVEADGGSVSVSVDAVRPDCAWTATNNLSWVDLSPAGGTGDGTVVVSVAPNAGSERSGAVLIGGRDFHITQDAASCGYDISPASENFPAMGGQVDVTIDASHAGCAWDVSTELDWVQLSQESGTGDGMVTLTVEENNGDERSGTVSIAGNAVALSQEKVNQPPVADAGADQTVDEGKTVVLNGENSFDADDGIHTVQWTQISGQPVSLSAPGSMMPSFTAPAVTSDGAVVGFALTVTDNGGNVDTDECLVNITWSNLAPSADAGPDQSVDGGATVQLNGGGSTDRDGKITDWSWEQTAGPAVVLSADTAMNPVFEAPVPEHNNADLVFELTVTDDGGLQDTSNCVINIMAGHLPPTANAGVDQTVAPGEAVVLNGTNTIDDGPIASYLWQQLKGPTVTLSDSSAVKPGFRVPDEDIADGTVLEFQLTVKDENGLVGIDTCIVNINTLNLSPTADAGADMTIPGGEVVTLDASRSSDPDDGISHYFWTQESGSPVTFDDSAAINPVFTVPGNNNECLTFMLTVTDHSGSQATDTCVVNVSAQGVSPVVDAGSDQIVLESTTVRLDGTHTPDSDGETYQYAWKQVAGTPVALSDASMIAPAFVAPPITERENLVFELTVADASGLKGTDRMAVEVLENGIAAFGDDAYTISSPTDKDIALNLKDGVSLTFLQPVDPSSLPEDVEGTPEDLIYGLIDLNIKVQTPGDAATLEIGLPEPAPEDYGWFKYSAAGGWINYSANAVFSDTREKVTLTLEDGGAGDDDGVANGVIVDPSGLGRSTTPFAGEESPDATSDNNAGGSSGGGGGEGGGGCFISSTMN